MINVIRSFGIRILVVCVLICCLSVVAQLHSYYRESERQPIGADPGAGNAMPLDYWQDVGADLNYERIERPENNPVGR
jgi:hypothetical protein